MTYKLYDERKINIDKDKLDLIIDKFSETTQKSGFLDIGNSMKYDFINKGGQGEVFSLSVNNNQDLAIKRGKANDNEKTLLKLMSGYVDSHICPHFLLVYDIRNVNYKDYIVMEKINGDLNGWLIEDHTDEEWLSFLFQFTVSVHVMQIYAKTYHNDLKPKNILFKTIDKNTTIEYNIDINNNKINYQVPLHGKLFIIGDFGHAQSLLLETNSMPKSEIEKKIHNNSDFEHIHTLAKRLLVDSIIKNYKLSSIIQFLEFNNVKYKEYYENEKRKITNELRKYPQHIKDDMLLKSLAYYVIEKDLYETMNITVKSKYKLPSNKIQQFILRNFDGKTNPELILRNEFNDFKNSQNNGNIAGLYVL